VLSARSNRKYPNLFSRDATLAFTLVSRVRLASVLPFINADSLGKDEDYREFTVESSILKAAFPGGVDTYEVT
jgi:hypothetical protein